MHLVMVLSNNRVNHVKAFDSWDFATMHADELVMDLRGVTNELPDWENGPYRNIFEHKNVAVIIEPCDTPEKVS